MSEPKFTPGPWWAFLGYGPTSDVELYVDADTVATKDDFRLINTAPELYDVLEEYLIQDENSEGYGGGIGGEIREKARAALAKARGESHE